MRSRRPRLYEQWRYWQSKRQEADERLLAIELAFARDAEPPTAAHTRALSVPHWRK